ncbi:bifunctional adenosylcobinamide kinase/adenosylcobinamide-phosphate guanylyltransferase [Ghiorsea bivora]|uniref:bifunctional adenosylcobinamide kinase/adenosylcobinamide-phosphate guanylyltransferase n=1 Tax=Ghiorsea bivora TaxID=1485545 RepID=UPI00056FECC3|nr:bifunctional adenosylcobinamide kinase/adenosylcobinamide-phosphate guanylyltransferase [Ghiorsea bivora]
MKTLILGGARSGKSQHAEALVQASGKTVVYVATAPRFPDDKEWQQRINKHQQQRPKGWKLIEEEQDLIGILQGSMYQEHIVLIDCLTLWLSNLLYENHDVVYETQRLCEALADYTGAVVMVSNEVGMGLVPDTALGRDFRDAQGRLNQAVAHEADSVLFVAAGLPLALK